MQYNHSYIASYSGGIF